MLPRVKDLCLYRIEKAKGDLEAAQVLFEMKLFSQSMNRSYYAIFHMARALLALDEFDTRKHTGIIAYFNKEYIAKGTFDKKYSKIIKGAERMRCKSDYDDFYIVSKDETLKQIDDAKQFIEELEGYIRDRRNLESHDSRDILLYQAGALADDENLDELRASIYAQRGRPEVENEEES